MIERLPSRHETIFRPDPYLFSPEGKSRNQVRDSLPCPPLVRSQGRRVGLCLHVTGIPLFLSSPARVVWPEPQGKGGQRLPPSVPPSRREQHVPSGRQQLPTQLPLPGVRPPHRQRQRQQYRRRQGPPGVHLRRKRRRRDPSRPLCDGDGCRTRRSPVPSRGRVPNPKKSSTWISDPREKFDPTCGIGRPSRNTL